VLWLTALSNAAPTDAVASPPSAAVIKPANNAAPTTPLAAFPVVHLPQASLGWFGL